MSSNRKHLLGLEGVSREDIQTILDSALSFKEILQRPIPKVPALRGVTVVNLFFEPSTRTRISFELAEKRLSADTVNFSSSTSSVKKGETLKDTARNIEAMKIDIVVIRHSYPGAPHFLANWLNASIINAGDGAHEHPTQGLLDLLTLYEKFGSFDGLKVLIVGDISHSRVARSNIFGLNTMGADVSICGPGTLLPYQAESLGVRVYSDLDEAIKNADVINVLRIQLERQGKGLLPSLREYRNLFGITRERLKKLDPGVVIMHPGPINRGVEIDSDVADSKQSVILHQVTNGVAVRMAVLYHVMGSERSEVPE
ncbi:MAG TPA: aspartate carbamoyltransferase catalytic subunit [Bacteroidetes bacterium]|nr:aspartate carbamoyltransferase catalytic subunit [Bacteroidota bacterium]